AGAHGGGRACGEGWGVKARGGGAPRAAPPPPPVLDPSPVGLDPDLLDEVGHRLGGVLVAPGDLQPVEAAGEEEQPGKHHRAQPQVAGLEILPGAGLAQGHRSPRSPGSRRSAPRPKRRSKGKSRSAAIPVSNTSSGSPARPARWSCFPVTPAIAQARSPCATSAAMAKPAKEIAERTSTSDAASLPRRKVISATRV